MKALKFHISGLLRSGRYVLQKARKRKASAKLIQRGEDAQRLHIGCGHIQFQGWVNLDGDPSVKGVDFLWDLSHGIPAPNDSCQWIYSEHFLEHLSLEQGREFLRECHRVLRPGGVVRIAMPSLDYLMEKAVGDWKDQDWLRWPGHEFIQTRAQMLNIAFRWWGHQWLYDRAELHIRLGEANFEIIEDCEKGQSRHSELCHRESRDDSRLICEATKK